MGATVWAYALGLALAAVGLAVTSLMVKPLEGPFFMFQFAAVVGAALHGGLGPGLVTMAVSGVGSHLLFFAPSLQAYEANRLASFGLVSVFFAWLAARMRHAKAAAEAAQQRAEDAEAEARKVGAQQERLVAVVSHDLRNPLHAVSVTAEQLQRRGELSEPQARGVARILTSARRMQSMIRDLLDYAVARAGAPLPVHRRPSRLGEVCAAAVDELRTAHPERSFTLTVSGDDAAALDPARVEQVVSNLVTNAIKHGAADTPVTLSVAGDAAGVRLEVANSGAAIPEHLLPTLFEPFRPGDAKGSVGLGLFIVREIARAHDGKVSVRSGDGGTTFTVELPKDARAGLADAAA